MAVLHGLACCLIWLLAVPAVALQQESSPPSGLQIVLPPTLASSSDDLTSASGPDSAPDSAPDSTPDEPADGTADEPADRTAEAKKTRRYRDGRLKPADYLAPVQAGNSSLNVRIDAYTFTDVHFRFEYQSHSRNGRWRVRGRAYDVFAVVIRDKSWLRNQGTPRLLDHEQGHFDLTQQIALEARLELEKMLKDKKYLYGSGTTEEAAVAELDAAIRGRIRPKIDANRKRQELYDRETLHGVRREPQRQHRVRQIARLNELVAELKQVIEARPERRSR